MKTRKTPLHHGLALLASSSLLALMTACGGGGGGAESAASTPATPVAETQRPLSVSGTVTGFGSVIIDGVTYDDSLAQVAVDNGGSQGSAGALSDLKLGMSVDAIVEDGKLKQVMVRATMAGPIGSIDGPNASFSVYGQTVKVLTSGAKPTLFAGVGALSGLAANDHVEVHGTLDAARAIVATRVERKPKEAGEPTARLGGSITGLNSTAKTFLLQNLTVDFSGAIVLPAGQVPADGQEVLAFGDAEPAADRFVARTLRIRAADEGAPVVVGGLVSAFNALADFSVAGQRVDASAANVVDGTASDVVSGQAVAVEGRIVSGVLRADKLRIIKTPVNVLASLKGDVSAFLSTANFKLRGVTVDASAATATGGSKDDLGNGAYVKVQGSVRGDIFRAETVEFLVPPAARSVKVTGELRDLDAQALAFKLMGLPVRLAQNVSVEGGALTALVNGRRVTVEGVPNADGVVVVSKLVLQPDVVNPAEAVLSGRAYDVSPSSFKLPGMTVTHSSATMFEGGTSADVASGDLVVVRGRVGTDKKSLSATWVEVAKGESPAARALGEVSDFVSLADFRIAGQRVDASAATVDGQVSSLVDGASVMATGSLVLRDGVRVFEATQLRFMQ